MTVDYILQYNDGTEEFISKERARDLAKRYYEDEELAIEALHAQGKLRCGIIGWLACGKENSDAT